VGVVPSKQPWVWPSSRESGDTFLSEGAFTRIKERNAQRIQESIRKGKVKAIFNSIPTEFKESSVILDVNGKQEEIPNDYVWIFAGGEPPMAFLKKIGVGFARRTSRPLQAKKPKRLKNPFWRCTSSSLFVPTKRSGRTAG